MKIYNINKSYTNENSYKKQKNKKHFLIFDKLEGIIFMFESASY